MSKTMINQPYFTRQRIGNALLWKDKTLPLVKLDMELTERCNNNCIHCCINLPADDLNAKKRELSTSQIKNILIEAAFLGCTRVRFTGGEPLLREDFEELYIFARKRGLRVMIFTNATLITSHFAKLFNQISPLEKIEVGVYGMKKSSYETVTRAPGSFEAAFRGINLLLRYKVPFVVKGAFLPYNKDEIAEFEKWAKTIPWMNKLPPYSMFFDLRCRRDSQKNELIKRLRITPEEGLKILARDTGRYLKKMREFCSKFMRPPGDTLFSCGSGKASGCVDAYGYFQPCLLLRHPGTVYNLKKGSLKDALTKFFPKLRQMKSANSDYLARCAKCFLKGLCEQCPAKSYMEHDTLDTPVDYLCEIAHAKARFLGLIGDYEHAWDVSNWRERINAFVQKKEAGSESKS